MRQINVNQLARGGLLTGTGTITWTIDDRVTSTVSVRGDGDSITLAYVIDGQNIEERVLLDSTPVHLGGHRAWFLCPGCDRRIAVLYGGMRFRCRYCHDLRYASQREGKRHRAISRIQKTRKKLSGTTDLTQPIPRPRYMHARTFERLVREEDAAWQALGCIGGH